MAKVLVHVEDGGPDPARPSDPAAAEASARAVSEHLRRIGRPGQVEPVASRSILRMRYGLGSEGGEQMTLKEIGKIVGLTRERVRQIEQEALRKLYGVMSTERSQELHPTAAVDALERKRRTA